MRLVGYGLGVMIGVLGAPTTLGEYTGFDELSEGFVGNSFVSGGIRFVHGTWFEGSVDLPFAVDDGSEKMPGLGFGDVFTPPNTMKVGGYSTGPGACPFVRVHSWEAFVPGKEFTQGWVDLFYIVDFIGTEVSLEALLDDVVVAADSFTITESDPFEARHVRMQVEAAAFDRLRFVCRGGAEDGGILGQFDNVGLLPEPDCLALIAVGAAFVRGRWGVHRISSVAQAAGGQSRPRT
jgi:hypothetical protein